MPVEKVKVVNVQQNVQQAEVQQDAVQMQQTPIKKPFNKSEFIKNLKNDFVSTVRKTYINSLQKEVGFREVTVKEQKALSRIMLDNEQRKDIIYDAQCALISQTCLDEEFDIYSLTEFDKIKLMLALYQTNMFKNDIKFKCPQCGTENQYKLNFSQVIKRLDEYDISDKPYSFENENWKFDFIIHYPTVRRISDFYRSFAKRYVSTSKKDQETLNNLINMDYVLMFVKKVTITNKTANTVEEFETADFTPAEIDEIFSAFPQDVMYVDDGIMNFISEQFIGKINESFEKHKCASCGQIYEEAIDSNVQGFF